jgi:hypothetical protein
MVKKHRKSPKRHRVKSHVRDGHRVHSYMRGRGGKPGQIKKKIKKVKGLRLYTVELTYEDGKKEIDKSVGYSVTEALLDAERNRKRKNVRVVKARVKNSELIDVMQEVTSRGARVARTAAGVIDDARDEADRYTVEDEWR